MKNTRVADILDETADLLELKDENPFRIRSYRQAALSIRENSKQIEDLIENGDDLTELANIGESIAEKLREIMEDGSTKQLDELREDLPQGLTELLNVPSLGPKKTRALYDALDIGSLKDLEKACETGKVAELEGFGETMQDKILQGIRTVRGARGRTSLKAAGEYVDALSRHLEDIAAIERFAVAGSFRRCKETVGDLDVLIQCDDPKAVTESILESADIAQVDSRGTRRLTVHLEGGLQVDFRFIGRESFGSALLYFTGSKAHNIKLRRLAQARDWKLNEYGLFKGDRLLAGKDERACYHRLNLAFIEPELREDRGEIEAAKDDRLPKQLVRVSDIVGEMHAHTSASDGALKIDEMVRAARARGRRYLAITDHSKAVRVANGLDEKRLKAHAETIRRANGQLEDFRLFAGVEVDILKNGDLDLDPQVLAGLDWVVASVHSHFDLSEAAMTERLVRALESGVVDCLGHPFGRMIGRREPIAFDMEAVFQTAREHDVALEINSHPDRLDLPDTACKRAKEMGLRFVISTDAHQASDLDLLPLGVGVARRGWLEKKDILNAKSAKELETWLKKRRS